MSRAPSAARTWSPRSVPGRCSSLPTGRRWSPPASTTGTTATARARQPRSSTTDEFRIEEWRLERRLGVSHFRLPPDYRRPRAGPASPERGPDGPVPALPAVALLLALQAALAPAADSDRAAEVPRTASPKARHRSSPRSRSSRCATRATCRTSRGASGFTGRQRRRADGDADALSRPAARRSRTRSSSASAASTATSLPDRRGRRPTEARPILSTNLEPGQRLPVPGHVSPARAPRRRTDAAVRSAAACGRRRTSTSASSGAPSTCRAAPAESRSELLSCSSRTPDLVDRIIAAPRRRSRDRPAKLRGAATEGRSKPTPTPSSSSGVKRRVAVDRREHRRIPEDDRGRRSRPRRSSAGPRRTSSGGDRTARADRASRWHPAYYGHRSRRLRARSSSSSACARPVCSRASTASSPSSRLTRSERTAQLWAGRPHRDTSWLPGYLRLRRGPLPPSSTRRRSPTGSSEPAVQERVARAAAALRASAGAAPAPRRAT